MRTPPGCCTVVILWIAIGARSAGAQTPSTPGEPATTIAASAAIAPVPAQPSPRAPFLVPTPRTDRPGLSGKVALPLYTSFITTQALDVHSTLRAIDAGGVEANGMVRWATSKPAAFIGLKAATTGASLFFVDRLRRHHPKSALFILVGLNTTSAVIVAHNYRASNQRR